MLGDFTEKTSVAPQDDVANDKEDDKWIGSSEGFNSKLQLGSELLGCYFLLTIKPRREAAQDEMDKEPDHTPDAAEKENGGGCQPPPLR